MTTVAYCSPFVPPEWIAAHGLRPHGLRLRPESNRTSLADGRGVCPYAGTLVDTILAGFDAAAIVLTTICDQMRYASALLEQNVKRPVFLFNVPSTWQTQAARRLYREELERLGRFLVGLGGHEPSGDELTGALLAYDKRRLAERASRADLAARESAIPLALVGGPLLDKDFAIFDLIERAGARVVIDGTEGGERTLPAAFNPQRVAEDPLDELTRAYFDTIPDVFRRPNDRLYDWLADIMAARPVRGILVRRCLWCDLWHAELHRLRAWSPVPILEIDVSRDEESTLSRTLTRLEAFLEMLR